MKDNQHIVINDFFTGKVIPKARPRFTRYGKPYTPKRSKDYETKLRYWLKNRYIGEPLDEPLSIELIVHREPPRSWSNVQKKKAYDGEIFPTTRPDVDNKVKQVLDAMNGVVFTDDARVVELTASKVYAERAGVFIRVERISTNE